MEASFFESLETLTDPVSANGKYIGSEICFWEQTLYNSNSLYSCKIAQVKKRSLTECQIVTFGHTPRTLRRGGQYQDHGPIAMFMPMDGIQPTSMSCCARMLGATQMPLTQSPLGILRYDHETDMNNIADWLFAGIARGPREPGRWKAWAAPQRRPVWTATWRTSQSSPSGTGEGRGDISMCNVS